MSLDLTQFHNTFFEESDDAVTSMEDALLKLTPGRPDMEVVNTIFRAAHSIKGGAATSGLSEVASFTHTLENLLDELRSTRCTITQAVVDLLLKSVDIIRDLLHAARTMRPVENHTVADVQLELEMLVAQRGGASATTKLAAAARATSQIGWQIAFCPKLDLLARGNDPLRLLTELRSLGHVAVTPHLAGIPPLPELDPEQCHIKFTIRLETQASHAAVREVFDWAEGDCELNIERLAGEPTAATPKTACHAPAAASSDTASIRVRVEKIDGLMSSIGELATTHSMICELLDQFDGPGCDRLRAGLAQLDRNVSELRESVMQVRKLPIRFVFDRFPRLVRDLAHKLGKQIDLKITGGDTEIDRTILEKIGDPLVHLVRNGIDHGVERPAVRVAAGKPATGTVHLHASQKDSSIVVEVSDDGGGLNRERLIKKATEKGVISQDAVLTDREVHELIFAPGLSTTDVANDVSGRGVGMDVVRRNVEALGGHVEIVSAIGHGSRFVINLPSRAATENGQAVNVGRKSLQR